MSVPLIFRQPPQVFRSFKHASAIVGGQSGHRFPDLLTVAVPVPEVWNKGPFDLCHHASKYPMALREAK
jgi:hypothetical protein